ncbi:hypothetical protein PTTG_27988 [Puccinia triticina 1-1 BBBD Race 1]|uniref:Uncharacterized protein n=1 Tax=Puccinia triticina (isolate 1-1 / race 1 (BBBD)) TaxID=630390 RepID=A0A180GFD1_PUCT1|nr:hypothetical protein PTTG_27988 [Puccinia triticina 1-1 BBBD Race 1]
MRSPASGRASVSHLAQFIIVACLCTSLLNASPLPVGTPLSTPSSHGSQPQSLSQFSKRMELAAAHGTEAASIVTHNSAETANTAKSHSNTPNLKVLHASSSGVDSAEDSQAVDSTTAGLSKIGTAPEQSQPPTKEALASDTKDVDVGPEAAAADNGLTTTAEPHKPAEADKIANEKPAGQVVEAPVTAPESSLLTTPDQNAAKPAEGEKIASEKPAGEVVEAPTTVNSEPESSPPTTSDQNAVKPATDDTSSRTPTTTADPKGAATPASADATTSAALQASSSGNDGKTVDGTAGVSNVDATLHPDLIRTEKSGSQDGPGEDPTGLAYYPVDFFRLGRIANTNPAGRSGVARPLKYSASTGTASEKSGSQDGLDLFEDLMSLDHDPAQLPREVMEYLELVLPGFKSAARSKLAGQPKNSASAPSGSDQLRADAAATTFDNAHDLAPNVAPEASHVKTGTASEKSGSQDGLVDDPMSLDHDSVKFVLRGVKNYVDLVLESVSPQSKWAGRPKLAGQPEDSASAGSVSDQPRSNAAATTFDNVHDLAPDVAPEASHVETDSLKLEQDASSETKKRKIKLNPIPETREFKPDSAIERDWDTFQSEGENKQAVLKASGAPPPRGILKKNGLSHVVATPTKAAEPMTTTPATQAASDASRVNADPVTEVNPANTLESSGSPPPPGIHNQDGTSHVVALPSEAAEPITATPATQAASDASRVNPDPVTEVNSANTLDSAGSPPHPGIQNQPPKEADKNLDPIVTVKSVNPDPATGKFPASTTPKEAPKPITTTPAAQEASDASRFKPDSAGTPSMFKKINLKKYRE